MKGRERASVRCLPYKGLDWGIARLPIIKWTPHVEQWRGSEEDGTEDGYLWGAIIRGQEAEEETGKRGEESRRTFERGVRECAIGQQKFIPQRYLGLGLEIWMRSTYSL
eukprot:747702-Hanusia_phi.AAC.1